MTEARLVTVYDIIVDGEVEEVWDSPPSCGIVCDYYQARDHFDLMVEKYGDDRRVQMERRFERREV